MPEAEAAGAAEAAAAAPEAEESLMERSRRVGGELEGERESTSCRWVSAQFSFLRCTRKSRCCCGHSTTRLGSSWCGDVAAAHVGGIGGHSRTTDNRHTCRRSRVREWVWLSLSLPPSLDWMTGRTCTPSANQARGQHKQRRHARGRGRTTVSRSTWDTRGVSPRACLRRCATVNSRDGRSAGASEAPDLRFRRRARPMGPVHACQRNWTSQTESGLTVADMSFQLIVFRSLLAVSSSLALPAGGRSLNF